MIDGLKGNKILQRPSIFERACQLEHLLAEALVNIGKFGMEMAPPYYKSNDLNRSYFMKMNMCSWDAKITTC